MSHAIINILAVQTGIQLVVLFYLNNAAAAK